MTLPLISIIIPTKNEENNIGRCLSSIFNQSYPQEKLEVIVVDNYSTDKTIKISEKYRTKVILNKVSDDLVSKMIGLKIAKGKYFMYLDSDIDLVGSNWFEKMLKPFQKHDYLTASFCGFRSFGSDNSLVRYLSYDILQRDPIYEFFSPSVQSTIVSKYENFFLCKYEKNKIPPSGLCLYKRELLLEAWDVNKENKFLELDNLYRLVNNKHKYFAYVTGIYLHHPFVKNLNHLLKKRLRNINKVYLNQNFERTYKWFSLKDFKGALKVFFWVVYATTLILPFLRGIYKSIKNKDIACIYEPLVVLLETWVIIFGFVYNKIVKL